MVARRSRTNTRQGKRQGQAAKQPDPPSWECNAGITKIKAQEGKGEPDARLCVLDTVDGHPQSGQYGSTTAVSGAVLLALLAAKRF